jgi:hypothetical protein
MIPVPDTRPWPETSGQRAKRHKAEIRALVEQALVTRFGGERVGAFDPSYIRIKFPSPDERVGGPVYVRVTFVGEP